MEVGLGAAGLAAAEGVLGVAGLVVAGELLALLLVGGRDEPVAGRGDEVVPVVGLKRHNREEGLANTKLHYTICPNHE